MRPFNLEKLRKTTNKIFGVKDGFFDPITWIDTGNYALNRMISGDFRKGIPLGGVTIFAGESGSGKSFFASGSIVRNAQAMGVTPIVLDSEGALHESWVRKLGVNVDPDTIFKAQVSMINDVARYIEETMKQYRDDNDGYPREKMQKVLFVVDSLGFLQTPTEVEQFEKHEMKGDKGIKPKMLKALVSNCIRLFSGYEVGLVATNHTYASQDMYKPDDKISGGEGQVYASSIVVSLNKSKLKTDEDGAKTKEVRGIVSKMKCVKSRFAKPFEEVEIEIPYDTGMDAYSGLFDMMVAKGAIKKDGKGAYYVHEFADGTKIKKYRKEYSNADFDRIMDEWTEAEPVPTDDELLDQSDEDVIAAENDDAILS